MMSPARHPNTYRQTRPRPRPLKKERRTVENAAARIPMILRRGSGSARAILLFILLTAFGGTVPFVQATGQVSDSRMSEPVQMEMAGLQNRETPQQTGMRSPDCTRKSIYTGGTDDSFAAPPDSVHPSPQLRRVAGLGAQYDERSAGKRWGDSFLIRECHICWAELEIHLRHSDVAGGDGTILVGGAPFTGDGIVWKGYAWSQAEKGKATAREKHLTIFLPLDRLNKYLCQTIPAPYLDLQVQSGTEVDYVKLTLWTAH